MTSSSESSATIDLRSESRAVELEVLDSTLTVVARGFGALWKPVPAGIYQVRGRLGPTVQQKLIAVREGEHYRDHTIRLEFTAAAPLLGTTAFDARHARALESLIGSLRTRRDEGEFVLFARTIRPTATSTERDRDVFSQLISRFALTSPSLHLNRTTPVSAAPRVEAAEGWAGFAISLPKGGYVLRFPDDVFDAKLPASTEAEEAFETLEQSIWIQAGWRTVMFVPVLGSRPSPQLATIHMMRTTSLWETENASEIQRIGLATEAFTASWRDGQSAYSPDLLPLIADDPFADPMIGIIASHSLLRESSANRAVGHVDGIISYLEKLVPGHPDVVALKIMSQVGPGATDLRADVPPPAMHPEHLISWPPMLDAGYRGLLLCDGFWPDVSLIQETSTAETVAARLVALGIWSTWRAASRQTASQTSLWSNVKDCADALEVPVLNILGHSVARKNWDRVFNRIPGIGTDPGVDKLTSYVGEIFTTTNAKTAFDVLHNLDVKQVSVYTGLPARAVKLILDDIRSELSRIEARSDETAASEPSDH